MLGLSSLGFAPPYSFLQTDLSGGYPVCRRASSGPADLVVPSADNPVSASSPLGLRADARVVPLYDFFRADRDLRSARAFHSGAVLGTEGPICGHGFGFYFDLSLGWRLRKEVAVSR